MHTYIKSPQRVDVLQNSLASISLKAHPPDMINAIDVLDFRFKPVL